MMIVAELLHRDAPGGIPLTMLLVVALYLGNGWWTVSESDNISQMTHIVGGLCGIVFGFSLARAKRDDPYKKCGCHMTSASFSPAMEPSILRGQHGKCFLNSGELALALIAHGPGDLSRAVVALSSRRRPAPCGAGGYGRRWSCRTPHEQFLHGGGFMRNCRDSCSMVMRLSRCSVRNRWTCRMTSSCSTGQLPQ